MMFHENCHRHICATLHSSRSASYYQNLFVVSCTLCLRLSISVSIKISLMSLFEENLGSVVSDLKGQQWVIVSNYGCTLSSRQTWHCVLSPLKFAYDFLNKGELAKKYTDLFWVLIKGCLFEGPIYRFIARMLLPPVVIVIGFQD